MPDALAALDASNASRTADLLARVERLERAQFVVVRPPVGSIPLSTLQEHIDYGFAQAMTTVAEKVPGGWRIRGEKQTR